MPSCTSLKMQEEYSRAFFKIVTKRRFHLHKILYTLGT